MRIFEASIRYSLIRLGETRILDDAQKVVDYMEGAFDEDPTVEWFYVVLLDTRNHPMARVTVTRGVANSSLVHPRETFKSAILAGATAIVAVHNHPSGDPAPSSADIKIAKQLRDAGEVIGIKLIDHIIIGEKAEDPTGLGFYSFQLKGLI